MSTSPRPMPPASNDADEKADRQKRYAELSRLLDEWANEPREIDEEIEPLMMEFLKETAPRLFPDD